MTRKWAAFPYPDKAYVYDTAGLRKAWPRLLDERSKELLREFGRLNQEDVRKDLGI